ncbi:translation initiation factor eIF 4e-like domain-containing protein [Lactifluus volemus]|nr:translation initiation factor eIF 4e-like domain-containing protein [Lactifluus volemus]
MPPLHPRRSFDRQYLRRARESASDNRSRGEPLTTEQVEKLAQKTSILEKQTMKKTKGFKNIPTLDAITAHYARTRTLSVEGTAVPPEAEPIEDPQTPGLMTKPPEHPLQHPWTIYHDTKRRLNSVTYEVGLTMVGEFDTVESYYWYFNWLKPPSKLERNSNYHLFKSGIKPMWEDEAGAMAWHSSVKNSTRVTRSAARSSACDPRSIVSNWIRSKDDVDIGRKLVKPLDVSEAGGISLKFQYYTEDRPLPNKLLPIHIVLQLSYRLTFDESSHRSW